jgi:hypothetical protein
MSLSKNVMVSAGLTFGLAFLCTAGGPAGVAAAIFTGLMWAGIVGAVTMAFSSDYRGSWPSVHLPHHSSYYPSGHHPSSHHPSSDRSFFAWPSP